MGALGARNGTLDPRVGALGAREGTLDAAAFSPQPAVPSRPVGCISLLRFYCHPFALTYHCFLAVPHGMWDLSSPQGLNPCPLQWKPGVLTTGPPGKSLFSLRPMQLLLMSSCCFFQFASYKQAVPRPAQPVPADLFTTPLFPSCTPARLGCLTSSPRPSSRPARRLGWAAGSSLSLQCSSLHGSAHVLILGTPLLQFSPFPAEMSPPESILPLGAETLLWASTATCDFLT